MLFPGFSASADFEPSAASSMAMAMLYGPQAVDQAVRHAIATCWMMMPEGKKTPEAVEAEIRRVVDRALQNLREDCQAFGLCKPSVGG